MYLDLETVLNAMSRSYHFNFTIIQPPFAGLEHFDNGLRKTLAPDFDFAEFGSQLLKKMPSNTFVTTLDELSCHYMLLKLPEAGDKVYMFGPVVRTVLTDEISKQIRERFGQECLEQVQNVYQNIHIAYDHSGQIFIQEVHAAAFPDVELKQEEWQGFLPMPLLSLPVDTESHKPAFDGENALLEVKFRLETQMMNAIAVGDSKLALYILSQLEQYTVPDILGDPGMSLKNQVLEASAICRYVIAESQKVHPSYVQRIHDAYIRKMGAVTNIREISHLTSQVIAAYCDCVQTYSLDRYSPLIRRVLNHIHLNLDSQLSLRSLALLCNVNSSYLSKLFRAETGTTLTEYVNRYRVERSIPLLRYTQMSIAQVSESVGFLDENYYARIFKRIMGVPPKTYRQQNKA